MKRPFAVSAGAILLTIAALLGSFVAEESTATDRWWHSVVANSRTSGLVDVANGLDQLGGGLIGIYLVPIAIGTTVLMLRGWRSALFAVTAFAVSAIFVQIMKTLFGRARPEDLLVLADYGSFPSGHTANAATITIVLWLLFHRLIVVIMSCLWVLLMALARTIVSAHWLTDTLGGTLLGVAAALLVAAVMYPMIEHDRPLARRTADSANRLPT